MKATKKDIVVQWDNGRKVTCPVGTLVRDLAPSPQAPDGLAYLGALVNNDVVSMSYPLDVDCEVRLITLADNHGWRIYRRSVSFLLAMTVRELYPEARFSIEHSLGTGFYCSFEVEGEKDPLRDRLAAIEQRMREYVAEQAPIERHKVSYTVAVKQFEEQKQWDKYNLLRYSNPPRIVTYVCDGFSDLAHGPLAPDTGTLSFFKLVPYPPGFVIQFPERDNAPTLAPFEPQPHLFQIFKEHKEWGRILGVNTVGRLNEIIANREIGDFIKIAEAFHEKKIAQLADHVQAHREHIKWILIAGPSSSGKTTFAKRLAVQLRVNGLRPITVSVDHYFVDRNHTPRDDKGDPDFEHIEAIDLDLFHDHMRRLDRGEEVELPYFNFEAGRREFRGDVMRLQEGEMGIVEGIHALNPRLSHVVPATHKYKIYISALTQLNLDSHNRVSTTDNRLMRRLVRDHAYRGHSALTTLQMWPSVRRGEKTWIFPYQQEADVAFNSALDYELAVLRPYVEPLLAEIKPSHPQYAEARRLQSFLASFLGISTDHVPPTSILREFIGHSSFQY